MQITKCPASRAATLVPLNLQVHAIHSDADPTLHVSDPAPNDVAEFLETMLTGGMTALVAGDPDTPVGYILYDIEDRPAHALRHRDRRAHLHHICVDAAARRSGIGTALVEAMLERLKQDDISRVVVTYATFNEASAALMKKAGFSPEYVLAARKM